MPRVLLGVTGGIAAYKAVEVCRRLAEAGCEVRVLMTPTALRFVGAATFEALSAHPVGVDSFAEPARVEHVALGRWAELVLVAPATADFLARTATGRADDLLTASLLTARCPVLLAPAMHTEMWTHPATQANVATLRSRGVVVCDPGTGRLTGSDDGPGRLPEPAELLAHAEVALARGPGGLERDLAGTEILVTAGGTREHLDAVRFLSNSSSGRQGVAIARAARLRGARVSLVAAHLELEPPDGVRTVRVGTAAELHAATMSLAAGADVVVMAAAVADHRPVRVHPGKLKKVPGAALSPIELTENPDVLAELAAEPRQRPGQLVVGFAAEAEPDEVARLAEGRAKLARKGADLLVVNEVGREAEIGTGLGVRANRVVILGRDGACVAAGPASKDVIAHHVLDAVVARRSTPPVPQGRSADRSVRHRRTR